MLGQPQFLLCSPSKDAFVSEQGAQCTVLLGLQAVPPELKPGFAHYRLEYFLTHRGLISCCYKVDNNTT